MRSIALLALTLGVFAAVPPAPAPQPRPAAARTMAVTIDDLPYVQHGDTGFLAAAQRDTAKIQAALKAHDAPAIGFVNEDKLEAPTAAEHEARIALLKSWLAAGHTLGNHTYSHRDIDAVTVEAF